MTTQTMSTKDITWCSLSNDVVNLAISYKYAVSYTCVPPPKKEVMFLLPSVCLTVCLSVG